MPTIKNNGSFRSWITLRSASPASNSPVHCTATIGRLPPRCKPAATANASPSRQTRIRGRPPGAVRAASHVPSSLSGSQTTCVMPQRLSAWTTEGPSSMGLLLLGRLELAVAHFAVDHLGQRHAFFILACVHRLGPVHHRLGHLGPFRRVAHGRLVLVQRDIHLHQELLLLGGR